MLKIESSDEDPYFFDVTIHDQGERVTKKLDRFYALFTTMKYVGEVARRENDKREQDSEQ